MPHRVPTRSGTDMFPRLRRQSALALVLVVLAWVPASAATPASCPPSDHPVVTYVTLADDGEARSGQRAVLSGDGNCVEADDGPWPVAVSILHRDDEGRTVEGARIGRVTGSLRTEVRVRDMTARDHTIDVDGPTGRDVERVRLSVPMMVVVVVDYPPGWQVEGPAGPGVALRSHPGGVDVTYAGLLFDPVTAAERVLAVDATPGPGRPNVTIRVTPLNDEADLQVPDGLLDPASLAVLGAFTALAVEGTEELADGTEELADGTRELADGTDELADGTRELADGTDELADGTRELADGTREFADGLAELAEGFEEFADGIGELAAAMPDIADGAAGIADGVAGVVGFLSVLRDGGGDLAFGLSDTAALAGQADGVATALVDTLDDLEQTLRSFLEDEVGADLDDLDDPGDAAIIGLLDLLEQATSLSGQLEDLVEDLVQQTGALVFVLDGFLGDPQLAALAGGAAELANGLNEIADVLDELADAAEELAEATEEIADAGEELADGTEELADGTRELADATDELADGTEELADGTRELADGTEELAEGTAELPEALQEVVDVADRAGQRASRTRAITVLGAQLAAAQGDTTTLLASAGVRRDPISTPLLAAFGVAAAAAVAGTRRAGIRLLASIRSTSAGTTTSPTVDPGDRA